MIESWEDYTLGEVAEFINGRAFKTTEWEDTGRRIIRIQDLTGKINDPHFTTKTFDLKYLVKKNDLLISWSATLDAFIWNGEDAWLNQHIFKVKEKPQLVNKKFLYYFVKNEIDHIKRQIHGSTMKHITKRRFLSIRIRLPPIQIQDEIVGIIEKAEQLKQWRKEADKLTDDYLNSVFLEMFGDPRRNPMKWEYKTLPEVVIKDKNAIKRGPFGGSLKKEIFTREGFLVYEQYHAINNDFSMSRYFIDEKKYRELEKFKVVPGDLIISCSGTLGRIAEIPKDALPGIINQALLKISLDRDKINSDYFQFLFRHKAIQNILFTVSRGSGISNFPPISAIKRIKFMVPPINLQNKFASVVEKVEGLRRVQEISKREITNLFNALNQEAFGEELNC